DRGGDEVMGQGHERGREQGVMNEAHGRPEDQHIGDDMPPRSPGRRDGASRHPGGAAAHGDGHEQENPERALEQELERRIHERAYCWSMIFSENRYPLFGIML